MSKVIGHRRIRVKAMPRTGRVLDAVKETRDTGYRQGGGSSQLWYGNVISSDQEGFVVSDFSVFSSATVEKYYFKRSSVIARGVTYEANDTEVFSTAMALEVFMERSYIERNYYTMTEADGKFAMKGDIPDVSDFATRGELEDLRNEIMGMLPEGGGSGS